MNAVLTIRTTNDWVEVLEAVGGPCGLDSGAIAKRRPASAEAYLTGIEPTSHYAAGLVGEKL